MVGFEQDIYSVGEGDDFVEVCVVLDNAGEFPPGSILLTIVAVGSSAEGEHACRYEDINYFYTQNAFIIFAC